MVASLFNSIQATLSSNGHAAGVASRIWTLAVQDLTQVGIVATFVIIGWLLASLMMHAFGLGAVAVNPKGKLSSKLADTVAAPVDNNEVSCSHDVERANAGLELLEHYGVFGTSLGAWTTDTPKEAREKQAVSSCRGAGEAEDSNIDAEEESSSAPLMPRRVLGSRTPRGISLLEQYGVFGVSPKHWSNTKTNGFGDMLASIT